VRALADSPADFRILGLQSSPKCEIPCFGRRRTDVQNLTPLVLSSAEKSVKSVTAQTNKQIKLHTKTVNDISACVDNKRYRPVVVKRYVIAHGHFDQGRLQGFEGDGYKNFWTPYILLTWGT